MIEKTILIVDDSDFDRGLLAKALSRVEGFCTLQASGGDQCLEIVRSRKIDLILMDIMMPGVFGTQVLMTIRKEFNLVELPIIMVSSKDDISDIIGCLQTGANDYITKPIIFDVAIARISTHLMLSRVSQDMAKLKELLALDAMITTYNHEINNPLTVAICCVNSPLLKDEAAVEKLKSSLWKIADIVKKIRAVTEKKEVEYQQYSGTEKMVKVK